MRRNIFSWFQRKKGWTDVLENRAGNPIIGASVYLVARNTSKPILVATTTDSNGVWAFPPRSGGPFDVLIIWGSKQIRRKVDDHQT